MCETNNLAKSRKPQVGRLLLVFLLSSIIFSGILAGFFIKKFDIFIVQKAIHGAILETFGILEKREGWVVEKIYKQGAERRGEEIASASTQKGDLPTVTPIGKDVLRDKDLEPSSGVSLVKDNTSPSPVLKNNTGKILITEALPGLEGNPQDECVEIFNTENYDIGLDDWSIVKINSLGKVYPLIPKSKFKDKFIKTKERLVACNSSGKKYNYLASILWSKSNTLAQKSGVAALFYGEEEVDRLAWESVTLGQSVSRDIVTMKIEIGGVNLGE